MRADYRLAVHKTCDADYVRFLYLKFFNWKDQDSEIRRRRLTLGGFLLGSFMGPLAPQATAGNLGESRKGRLIQTRNLCMN